MVAASSLVIANVIPVVKSICSAGMPFNRKVDVSQKSHNNWSEQTSLMKSHGEN